jgi:hypothetical protein
MILSMLQRLFVHISLVLLFAFTQIGVATHEISHFNKPAQQTQPDKNTAAEQCGQCIAYAQSANALPTHHFVIPLSEAQFQLATAQVAQLTSRLTSPYSARAPPFSSMS